MIWTKGAKFARVQNFRLLTTHIKMTKFVLDRLLKVYKILPKKHRGVISWPLRLIQNLEKNWPVVSNMTRIWLNLIRGLKSLQNMHFHLLLLCRVFNVWRNKVHRSCLSQHWMMMQNLKKNWLVVWKMTWGIWQISTRAI